jgi:hypothetical protein
VNCIQSVHFLLFLPAASTALTTPQHLVRRYSRKAPFIAVNESSAWR